MRKNLNQFKKSALGFISGLSLLLIIWLVLFGKIKAAEFLRPLLEKIPRDESGLTRITDQILGEATKNLNNENLKKAAGKGSDFFENSEYAQPARDLREDLKKKIQDSVDSLKDLPAQEIKLLKKEVCQEWMKDEITPTPTGNN